MTAVEGGGATWHDVQQAWSKGNLEAARAALLGLIESGITENADTWRLWGDTAAALRDLRLAAGAYEQANRCVPPGQPMHRWLNRYLYVRLQAGAPPQEIEREYRAAPMPPGTLEDDLIGLALKTDLYHRLGNLSQAAFFGKNLSEQWLAAPDAAFEFLEHVQERIWLTLARLAEETGDVPAARRFLLRLDDLTLLPPDLKIVAQILRALLDQPPRPASDQAETGSQITQRLSAVLSADLSVVRPPIPAPLLASLHRTLTALQAQAGRLPLLDEAIEVRPTNLLARRLRNEERIWHEGEAERALAAEASLWLTTDRDRYQKSIARFLVRPPAETEAKFSFVALGGGSHVGGSAHLLNLNGTKLLLDVGLDVATSPASSYQRLKHALAHSGIVTSLADLDAVLISHAHLDHVGLLPALYTDPDLPRRRISSRNRPMIHFYASEATRGVARIMLEDASRLMAGDAKPLYGLAAVAETFADLRPPKDGLLHLFRNLGQVDLLESGHILGSVMMLLEKDGLRVLYTGDFNTRAQLTLPASASLKGLRPDVLIMESTYGYGADEWALPRDWLECAFIDRLDQVLRRGGVALLPAFAVGRSQEVLGLVAEHARQNPDLFHGIFLDGLSRVVTNCYDRFDAHLTERYRELRAWVDPRLTIVPDDADREVLIREQILGRPNVVIASSGMLQKGSVSYQYAVSIADGSKNAIFYTGYLAEDSEAIDFLGGESRDLADIQCEQQRFSFSAHAPKEDLLQFVIDVQPRAVILVHGDARKRTQVRDNLYALLRRLKGDSFQVFVGQEGHRVDYGEGRFHQR